MSAATVLGRRARVLSVQGAVISVACVKRQRRKWEREGKGEMKTKREGRKAKKQDEKKLR